jgi:hypothetical protein
LKSQMKPVVSGIPGCRFLDDHNSSVTACDGTDCFVVAVGRHTTGLSGQCQSSSETRHGPGTKPWRHRGGRPLLVFSTLQQDASKSAGGFARHSTTLGCISYSTCAYTASARYGTPCSLRARRGEVAFTEFLHGQGQGSAVERFGSTVLSLDTVKVGQPPQSLHRDARDRLVAARAAG